ncbi:MAG: diguanylate cyclase [Idiomarina sp.]
MNALKPSLWNLLNPLLLAVSCIVWAGLNPLQAQPQPAMPGITPETIKYCVDPDWMPYEAIRDGKHTGLSADYLELISSYSGLQFELVPTKSWQQSLQYLEKRRCQFTPMLNKTDKREKYLTFSTIYFRSPNVLVSTREQPFLQGFENIGQRTVAIPTEYRLMEYVRDFYPNTSVMPVRNEREGLSAVAEGDADLFIGSLYSVNAYIQRQKLNNLKISGWMRPEDELRMGVSKGSEHLLPAINAALAQIDENQHLEIFQRWNNISVIDDTNHELIWQVSVAAIVVIILLIWWSFMSYRYNCKLSASNGQLEQLREKLEQTVDKLEFLSQHDPLTTLHNRSFLQQVMLRHNKDQREHAHEHDTSLIIVDIDLFKRINDTFGHSAGDKVLIEFAQLLQGQTRESDILARWGGEEFVIVCAHSNANDATRLCERINEALEGYSFSYQPRLTCSFGIAQVHLGEPIEGCFDRADKALYQAKETGRNRICSAEAN